MEYKFTKENFSQEVVNSDLPVLIDFYANWCGPCRRMMPIVEEMSQMYDGRIKVGKVDTDAEPELAEQFRVMSIPSFFFIKNGKVVNASIGGMSKEAMMEKINAMLAG